MILSITLLFELFVFCIFMFKSRKALVVVTVANIISVLSLYVVTLYVPFSGYTSLVGMELLIVIFEAIFFKLICREISFKKILLYAVTANVASVFFGALLLALVAQYI